MAKTQASDLQKQQMKNQKKEQRSPEEKAQDIKNAAFIASIDQPNHPNT